MPAPKRAKLSKVQFDIGFFKKSTIRAIRFRFGDVGLLLYMALLLEMGGAENAEIDEDAARETASGYGFPVEKTDEFLRYCLERGSLSQGSRSFLLTNSRVIADQVAVAKKQEQWRNRQRGHRANQQGRQDDEIDNEETSEGVAPVSRVTRELTEDLKIEDLNIKERGCRGKTHDPLPLTSGQCRRLVEGLCDGNAPYFEAELALAREVRSADPPTDPEKYMRVWLLRAKSQFGRDPKKFQSGSSIEVWAQAAGTDGEGIT